MTPRRTLVISARARRLAQAGTLLGGLGASLLLAGCGQLTNPTQTDVPYQAADGVAVQMGEVQIRGLVVVSDAKGAPGTLVGSLVNSGSTAAVVSIAPSGTDGTATPVTVGAPRNSSTSLSTDEQVIIPSVSVAPGDVLTLQIGTRQSGLNVVQVPVLPAREYYADYAPTVTPSTAATGSPTSEAPATEPTEPVETPSATPSS